MVTVVLEGPDNSGKTTLAQRLCKVARARYFHPGGAPADLQAERACLIDQQQLVDERPVVIDRVTCISQQVYNPDPELDRVRDRHLAILAMNANVFIVYCRPSNEHLTDVANFTWRPEETEEHRQKIVQRAIEWVERYDRLMQRVACVHYDFKDSSASVVEQALAGALTNDHVWIRWLNNMITRGRQL